MPKILLPAKKSQNYAKSFIIFKVKYLTTYMRNILVVLTFIIFSFNLKTLASSKLEQDSVNKELAINKSDIVMGNPDASVIFVEYFSPTCSHCAYYHKTIFPELQKKYLDTHKIAYVMREFISNKQDFDAAILARCTGNKDDYLKFTHVILEQQNNWAFNSKYKDILTNIAQLGGVSAQTYLACLDNNQLIETLITNTKNITKSAKFVGTPTFFINGEQFSGSYTIDAISKSIDKALEKTQATK